MGENNRVKLTSEQKQEINDALDKGNTKRLFCLLAGYLNDNDFSIQDAAVSLISAKNKSYN